MVITPAIIIAKPQTKSCTGGESGGAEDLSVCRLRRSLHETGMNSDRYELRAVRSHYMRPV